MGPMGVYRMFRTGHGEEGGIMTRTPETPASFWLYYVNVEALDPQGGMFALVAPKR